MPGESVANEFACMGLNQASHSAIPGLINYKLLEKVTVYQLPFSVFSLIIIKGT